MHVGWERVPERVRRVCRLNAQETSGPTVIHMIADLCLGSWPLRAKLMQAFRRRGPGCGNDMVLILQHE